MHTNNPPATYSADEELARKIEHEGDANLDPLTGATGAHPLGVGVGAALGGAAAGAATGTVAGPVGTVIGAAIGAIVGGLAGKSAAEAIDPTVETTYWHDNYRSREYAGADAAYDDYGPAYDHGVEAYRRNPGRRYDEVAGDLARSWETARGTSPPESDRARHATRDAWQRLSDRVERAVPGDADRDGK